MSVPGPDDLLTPDLAIRESERHQTNKCFVNTSLLTLTIRNHLPGDFHQHAIQWTTRPPVTRLLQIVHTYVVYTLSRQRHGDGGTMGSNEVEIVRS